MNREIIEFLIRAKKQHTPEKKQKLHLQGRELMTWSIKTGILNGFMAKRRSFTAERSSMNAIIMAAISYKLKNMEVG